MATNAADDTDQSRQTAAEPFAKRLTLPRIAMAAFGPLAAMFAAWAEKNPIDALPVLATWAALWFFGEIAADFIGRIWAKLRDRLVDRAADRLDLWLGNMFSGHRRRYLRDVVYQHRNVDLKGLTRGAHVLGLKDVFVDVSVAPIPPDQASADMIRKLAPELREGRHQLWDLLQAGGNSAKFVILGAPGSGKTTLLRHVALTMAQGRSPTRRLRARRNLPILFFLRDHAKSIAERLDIGLGDLLADYLKAKRKLDIPAAWFQSQLEKNRCLVLLDGLDEVADPDVRGKVVAWAEQQMSIHGDNRFVVTSRPHGYPDKGMGEVTVLDIRPFTGEQIKSFLRKWYLADEIKSQGCDDPGVRRDAEDGAEDLLRRLYDNPTLSDLGVNPLLLTMIAIVHRSGRALPGSRAELYAEICEASLGKRQQAKGIELALTIAQKQRVLEPLAWHMMEAEKRELALDEAAKIITGPLKKVDPKTTPLDFLINVEQSSSLLLEREGGVYGFAHLTFQEFLAACHAQQAGLTDRLVERVGNPWWREVLCLYAARSDATPILRACIADASLNPAALALALECRDEAKEIDPLLRAELDRLVSSGLDELSPVRRKPIVEALLKLRLGRLRRLDDNCSIDRELITCAEYQLFIDEQRVNQKYYKPYHWIEERFPAGTANVPVTSVYASDAAAFCEWLTHREATSWVYRLPRTDEIETEATLKESYWIVSTEQDGYAIPSRNLCFINDDVTITKSIEKFFTSVMDFSSNDLAYTRDLVGNLYVGHRLEYAVNHVDKLESVRAHARALVCDRDFARAVLDASTRVISKDLREIATIARRFDRGDPVLGYCLDEFLECICQRNRSYADVNSNIDAIVALISIGIFEHLSRPSEAILHPPLKICIASYLAMLWYFSDFKSQLRSARELIEGIHISSIEGIRIVKEWKAL